MNLSPPKSSEDGIHFRSLDSSPDTFPFDKNVAQYTSRYFLSLVKDFDTNQVGFLVTSLPSKLRHYLKKINLLRKLLSLAKSPFVKSLPLSKEDSGLFNQIFTQDRLFKKKQIPGKIKKRNCSKIESRQGMIPNEIPMTRGTKYFAENWKEITQNRKH